MKKILPSKKKSESSVKKKKKKNEPTKIIIRQNKEPEKIVFKALSRRVNLSINLSIPVSTWNKLVKSLFMVQQYRNPFRKPNGRLSACLRDILFFTMCLMRDLNRKGKNKTKFRKVKIDVLNFMLNAIDHLR